MLSHLRRWRAACAILIQPSLCYELLHTIFPTGPQPSFCLQEKWSLIATSRHSVFSSFFYMLLDAWLSALNSDFSSLCWFLGWFCFSWCSWLIPCCFLALPVNPHYLASNLYLCLSSQIQAPRNVFHSCWSTKFHSTRPHPCTDTPLKVLSPPSSVRFRLPCLAGCLQDHLSAACGAAAPWKCPCGLSLASQSSVTPGPGYSLLSVQHSFTQRLTQGLFHHTDSSLTNSKKPLPGRRGCYWGFIMSKFGLLSQMWKITHLW